MKILDQKCCIFWKKGKFSEKRSEFIYLFIYVMVMSKTLQIEPCCYQWPGDTPTPSTLTPPPLIIRILLLTADTQLCPGRQRNNIGEQIRRE